VDQVILDDAQVRGDPLAQAQARFTANNPASQAAHERAVAVMPGGNTRTTLHYSPFPLTMAGGVGSRLTDLDGHTYVDLLGEYTAGLYGHNNPVIRRAIDAALDGGWNLGAHGVTEAKLAGLLCERFPSVELVRFTNSGTEANLLALATACATTGRRKVLVFDGAYHGSILSFGGGGIPINAPHDWVVGTYNDTTGSRELIRHHGADLAAILAEPMLGSGGCVPADPQFLTALRDGADATGAVLIFDEVMTSRMSDGGLQKRLGITPDLTTLGKYIGGGMTFGAFGGRRRIMSMYDPRRADAVPHAGTFNNNVLSMAAGYAGLSELFTADISQELFDRGERLRTALNAACAQRAARMQWTGLGSLLTVHFQTEPIRAAQDIRPESDRRELFHLAMLEHGFYLARRGMIALSLEVSDEDCADFCAAVEKFLETDH
ncbi:MAG: aminotransferase class III-fold pyridoxal phosphate-dependent enzyme, partial [Jatrophihabitans sp.]|nr:aminotransferase class III-fold pyridoxal phosphate-dependent enzyme [Jatrophihabitans sp.]